MADETTQPSSSREWSGSSHRQTFSPEEDVSTLEIEQRLGAGWRVRAIEWVREDSNATVLQQAEVPYGLRVAGDQLGKGLEDDPGEIEVLLEVLSGISADQPLSQIADTLNRRCALQRNGQPWTQVALFQLLPRIIEVGPQLLSSRQWREMRRPATTPSMLPTPTRSEAGHPA